MHKQAGESDRQTGIGGKEGRRRSAFALCRPLTFLHYPQCAGCESSKYAIPACLPAWLFCLPACLPIIGTLPDLVSPAVSSLVTLTCNAPCCLLLSAVYITISYRQYRHVPPPRNDDDSESIAAASGAGGGVGDGGGGGPAVPPWSSGSFPPSKIRKIYDTYVQQGATTARV